MFEVEWEFFFYFLFFIFFFFVLKNKKVHGEVRKLDNEGKRELAEQLLREVEADTKQKEVLFFILFFF